MKKWLFLSISMVAMHLIYPLCLLIALVLDVEFILYNQLAYEIAVAVLFYAAMILRLVKKAPATTWDLLLIPAVLLGGTAMMARAGLVSLLFMAVNLLWAGVLTCRRKGAGRFVVIALCIPAAYVLYCWGAISYLFSNMTNQVLLEKVESPSGKYTAEVLRKTVWPADPEIRVEVVNNGRLTVLFGRFQHKPQHLYLMIDEDEAVQIIWLDEDTLSVNGEVRDVS